MRDRVDIDHDDRILLRGKVVGILLLGVKSARLATLREPKLAPKRSALSLPYLPTQSLHQPCGLIGPSTSVQEDGGTNSLQFAQLWLPFGRFW